jgi:4-amino-4-deoxy-L-arabinose transferase-like glycosyltransferase
MSSAPFRAIFSRPAAGLGLLCAAQIGLWSAAPLLGNDAPPLDVAEMYAWGREGVVATFKHPNLPGLVLDAVRHVIPGAFWPAFIVSQIFIAATFVCVFALGRELMDDRRALAGALLLTGVAFFSWPTPEFNHNVAQMPLWAGIALMLWRASSGGKLWHWALLGALGGLSLWAKYSSGVFLLFAFVWMIWDARARQSFKTPGPYLALVTFAAFAAPQIQWLIAHEFQPFAYAARRAQRGGLGEALEFLPVQIINHLPMILMLWAAGLFGKAVADAPAPPERRALQFLLLMGLGPVLLTGIVGALTGSGLKTAWAAPMFNLSGLLAIALLSSRFGPQALKRIAIGAGILLVLVPALYLTQMRAGPGLTGRPVRGNWPQAEVSLVLAQAWHRETGGAPLSIVAGDIWTASLISLDRADPPSVLINGDLEISPWVSPERLAREGALLVWTGDEPPEALAGLAQGLAQQTAIIPFAKFPNLPPLEIHYAALPPR